MTLLSGGIPSNIGNEKPTLFHHDSVFLLAVLIKYLGKIKKLVT